MTDLGAFHPTHVVAESGVGAWNEPDGQQAVAAWLPPGTELSVEQWQGAWAHAVFANGWRAWVDGRQLHPCQTTMVPAPPPPPTPTPASAPAAPVPAPPAAAPRPWTPTNVVGAGGLQAWAEPDPTQQPTARIDPGVEVAVTEHLANGWANVTCANGWTAWVDGRQLQPLRASAAASAGQTAFGMTAPSWWPAEIPLVAGAAAVLVIVGSFLPWVTFGPFSASGWDVSLGYVITGGNGITGGLKVGFVLLGVVVVGLPALTHKPLPTWVVPTVGAAVVALSGVTLLRVLTTDTSRGLSTMSLSPTIGLFVVLAAGIVILVDWARQRATAG